MISSHHRTQKQDGRWNLCNNTAGAKMMANMWQTTFATGLAGLFVTAPIKAHMALRGFASMARTLSNKWKAATELLATPRNNPPTAVNWEASQES